MKHSPLKELSVEFQIMIVFSDQFEGIDRS